MILHACVLAAPQATARSPHNVQRPCRPCAEAQPAPRAPPKERLACEYSVRAFLCKSSWVQVLPGRAAAVAGLARCRCRRCPALVKRPILRYARWSSGPGRAGLGNSKGTSDRLLADRLSGSALEVLVNLGDDH